MLAGAGANIGVLVGPDGFIVVDTGAAAMTDKVLQTLDMLAERHTVSVQGAGMRPKIRYIFNTSAHPDHVGGNEKLPRAGLTIFPGGGAGPGLGSAVANAGAAAILGHDNVTQRMGDAFPVAAWPTEGYTGRMRSVLSERRRHSDGLSAGGVLRRRQHRHIPPRRRDHGGRDLRHDRAFPSSTLRRGAAFRERLMP